MNYSRWASIEEIKENLEEVNLEKGITKSGIPIYHNEKSLYVDTKAVHNLIIGSTGSGKTQTIILPVIKQAIIAKESIIVNDPLGEIYKETGSKLKEDNYKTIVLDLNDSRLGNNWNPLELPYQVHMEGNKDKAIELIEDIAYYLFTDEKDKASDPFWNNSVINLFTGTVLYLFKNVKKEEINLNSVCNIINKLNDEKISEKFQKENENNFSISLKIKGTLMAPKETRGSIISVFNQKIDKYLAKENLANMLSISDFDFKELASNKTAVFLTSSINTYAKNLIPLFMNQIIDATFLYGDRNKRTNIILDEFDSLIPITNFSKKLSFCRSLNIRVTATIQSYIHLANMYSKEEVEILKMCFGNRIYLLSEDIYTLEDFSKECGEQELNGKIVPLITKEELKTLKPFEAIVLMIRMMPFKTELLPDYKINWGYETKTIDIPERKKNEICIFEYEK